MSISGVRGGQEVPEPVAGPEDVATPEVVASTPPSTPDRSRAGRLLDRGLREIGGAAERELLKPHEVDSDVKLVDGLKAGVRVKEEVFLKDHKTVADDPLRKATTARLAAPGKSVAWGKVEGELSVTSDWKTATNGVTVGFPAGAKLGYTLLSPVAYKEDGRIRPFEAARTALSAQTVDLPVTAKNARDLEPGTEFRLKGELYGGVSGSAGGLALNASRSGTATIDVRREEGDKVTVSVTRERIDTRGGSFGTGVLSTSASGTSGEAEVERFTLDLAKGQAQAAYGALLRGDTGAARAVAAAGGGVVALGASTEEWSGRKLAGGLSTKLASGFGAGLSIYDEKISERDPRLTKSEMRTRLSNEAKATGEPIAWHGTGGAIEVSLGAETRAGVASVGFSAKGVLEYHAIAPASGDDNGRLLPTELPLDATKARALAEGTEVTISGAGSLAVSAGAGFGASVGVLGASVGYGVGAKTDVKVSESIALNVTKLEGDKVRVIVADRGTKSAGLTVSADAGLKVDRDEIPGGSALEGIAGDKLGGKAKDAVAKELTKILSVKASFGVTAETQSRDVAAYDLDLGTETGRAAYDKLLRLDAREAERLSSVDGSGVSRVGTLDEEISSRRTDTEISVLGQRLLDVKGDRRDRVAQLVNGAGATTTIAEHEYTRTRKGLLKRGDIEWEAIQVKDGATGHTERFLHMKLGKLEDKWTSHDEALTAERFAGLMGATVTERHMKNADPSWWNRHVSASTHGKTTASADVYFTEAAMNKIAVASTEEAILAFGRTSAKLDGDATKLPGWAHADPAVRGAAREFMDGFDPFDRTAGGQREAMYHRLTGRNLHEDHATFEDAQDFATFVDTARTGDESARLKAFADLGAERGFDFHTTIGAMNDLAGDDVVLLNRFEVVGKEFKITTSSEGAIARPDTAVAETFIPK